MFDNSTIEDKPETPGENPNQDISGLGGLRPLGKNIVNITQTVDTSPVVPPIKKRIPSVSSLQPSRLDHEVSHI